jgi:predicted AAA+ superfamily ATPase
MLELKRLINIPELLEKKSFFLFGPRSTGKSSLIRRQLGKKCIFIDLLDGTTYLRLADNPSLLDGMVLLAKENQLVVAIDEIQKLPQLLDQVHRLIEKEKLRFLLTGSSARKLRHGAANLLAGRAWEAQLFPLVFPELPKFDLARYLRYGGLPQVYLSADPEEELSAYVHTYLVEEIQAEGLVRKLPQFSRFLKIAALSNSQLINFSSIGSDASISASTVREYFSILNDTLVGFLVEPWIQSKKRKAIQTAKFYFFDTGVTHTLAGTEVIDRNSDLFGKSFEQWIGMELRAYISYRRLKKPLNFWRTVNGQEVDFLVGQSLAVEVKSTEKITRRDLSGLKALAEENAFAKYYCVSQDQIEQILDGIHCVHWNTFIKDLWADKLI